MSQHDKPLPNPPKTPFGKKRMSEEEREDQGPLMADQMALAAASGNLDEFMQKNLPDNEHARKLAMIMMGMTGMMPPMGFPVPTEEGSARAPMDAEMDNSNASDRETPVPEEVTKAVQAGDMHQLMELLRREHQKRTGSEIPTPTHAPAEAPEFNAAPAGIEKEVLDRLLEIAASNNVTLDWLILRALKVYIEEHRKTGRL